MNHRELKHLSTDSEKSTERPKVVASEIGKTCQSEGAGFESRKEEAHPNGRERVVGESQERIPPVQTDDLQFLVNSYMTCGWKKVEPPTKERKNLRD
jgi:hypothetical protein